MVRTVSVDLSASRRILGILLGNLLESAALGAFLSGTGVPIHSTQHDTVLNSPNVGAHLLFGVEATLLKAALRDVAVTRRWPAKTKAAARRQERNQTDLPHGDLQKYTQAPGDPLIWQVWLSPHLVLQSPQVSWSPFQLSQPGAAVQSS